MDKRDIIERMGQVKRFKNLSDTQVGMACGVTKQAVGLWWNMRTDVLDKHITAFLEYYTDINANWLLFGRGEMMAKDIMGSDARIRELQEILKTKESELQYTREMLARQDRILGFLEKEKA